MNDFIVIDRAAIPVIHEREIQVIETKELGVTDLLTLQLKGQEPVTITGRVHLGNGRWRLWNSEITLEVEEINGENP